MKVLDLKRRPTTLVHLPEDRAPAVDPLEFREESKGSQIARSCYPLVESSRVIVLMRGEKK